MPENGSSTLARNPIEATFRAQSRRIFSQRQLLDLIAENIDDWWLPDSVDQDRVAGMLHAEEAWESRTLTARAIVLSLVRHDVLERIQLPFPHRAYTRFAFNDFSTYELLQSLDQHGYFSHYTAIQIHGLTEQIPKEVYFNVEQPATGGGGSLSQEGIDRAFKGRPRITSNVVEFRGRRIFKLNGMNTGQLGVNTIEIDESRIPIRVTEIERTLIDIAVRPMYAGGVSEVAKAYRAAADRCSVEKLVAHLRKMNFTYPYHQAIGYYLERASAYPEDQVALLEEFPMKFDFYLTYKMRNTDYNERWRLFVPKGF